MYIHIANVKMGKHYMCVSIEFVYVQLSLTNLTTIGVFRNKVEDKHIINKVI